MKRSRFLLIAVATVAVLAETPAIAASGGSSGGGGSQSGSGMNFDPAKRYAQGVEFLKAENYKQAEKAFEDVLNLAAKDANTNYMMALAQVGLSLG